MSEEFAARDGRRIDRQIALVLVTALTLSLVATIPAGAIATRKTKICATYPFAARHDCFGPRVDVFAGTRVIFWAKDRESAGERITLWATAPGSTRAKVIARVRFNKHGIVRFKWHAPAPANQRWHFWYRQPDSAQEPIVFTGELRVLVYVD
jgi:hypothetical protein